MKKELDVIEFDNGLRMPVIDAISYQGKVYVLFGNIEEDSNIIRDAYVYEKIGNDIVVIEDDDLAEKLCRTFEKRLSEK